MSLDKKLKQAAFDTVFSFFLKNKDRSTKYAAKGIIDAANTISKDKISEQSITTINKEFLTLMEELKEDKINESDLKNWVIHRFHLF
ncbi:hypothetical protein [Clostridium sp. Marseille-P299]|uniref:hypothetical protein n=1 Tax=Clostridium sp. Marseille-P299 TaxID=1805477 RepID=UPI000833E379|nr:hypothetical protein [Clostridium sp. Marseille-P299]